MSKFWTNVSLDKNNLIVRGYENGMEYQNRIPVKPHLYVDDPSGQSEWRTVEGKPVVKKVFANVNGDPEKRRRDGLKPDGVPEGIMAWRSRNASSLNMYGLQTSKSWYYIYYDYLQETYPDEVKYDASLMSVANIDIEVAADEGFPDPALAEKPITAIAVQTGKKVVVFGCGDFTPQDPMHKYFKCKDEKDLLRKFVDVFTILNPNTTKKKKIFIGEVTGTYPDVITGWNVESFDIPYLINRMVRLFGNRNLANRLSPWGKLDQNSRIEAMTGHKGWDIIGISILDYLAAYKKFTYAQQSSYSLDNIANVELKERKLDYSEYDGLMGLYKNNYQKFIEYNIKDTLLVQRLDDKMKLLELMYAIAYDAKVNLNDAFTSVRLWDVMINNYLASKKIVVPRAIPQEKERKNIGGYVKNPQRGMQEWIVSFDLNSLYPHLIMQYNISPETYRGIHSARTSDAACDQSIDEILDGAYDNIDNPEDNTIGGSGAMYTKDFRGFLPTLMEKTYADRVVWKNKLNEAKKSGDENEISRCDNMQMAKKIQLNSAYGALANPFFRWFKLEYAESITASGQLSIRWIEKKINEWMNVKLKTDGKDYVVAIDTDSVYVSMKDLVTEPERGVEQLHNFTTDTFEPLINKWYVELAKYTNAYAQRMVMKREVIADRGVWTSKKHYALNVWDMEGFRYKVPQQKVMGLEVVRSSTPNFCRVAMKSALRILLNENEARFIEFIENFRKEFFALPFEDIAFPRGVSNLAKWQEISQNRFLIKKGCPIHVRGSITFNNMLLDHNLIGKYDLVNQGDKIKFAYLKLPNPSREHVISVPSTLPKQFGLDKYIDYEKQFSKSFLDPIKTVADAADWKVEHMLTLEDFWT